MKTSSGDDDDDDDDDAAAAADDDDDDDDTEDIFFIVQPIYHKIIKDVSENGDFHRWIWSCPNLVVC